MDLASELGRVVATPWQPALLMVVGWVVRVPLLSRQEGHEAITREAWQGLGLTRQQRRALIRGVRAPDVSPVGLLTSALPFAQRRHALRAWSGSTTADGIHDTLEFMTARHLRGLALPEGPRRWRAFGEVLHCLQDSYSPAHVDRAGGRILHMKHWGPLDPLQRALSSGHQAYEHRFPLDGRDRILSDGTLTDEARAAAAASRGYLELATRHAIESWPVGGHREELAAFLSGCLGGGSDTA